MTNKQLLKIWKRRLARRQAQLVLLSQPHTLNHKKIAKKEYQVMIARKKVNMLEKKIAKRKLSVHKPKIQVRRIREGNTHGRLVPKVVVLHSTESHDHPGTIDVTGVLKFLEKTEDELGVHFVVDKEGNAGQGARINQVCYHAKGANSFSLGIEQIGFAYHTHWDRSDRTRQLEKVAKFLAWLSKDRGIPLKHSTTHGIAMHSDILAGGHTDPGPNYPLSHVLKLAKKYKKTGW